MAVSRRRYPRLAVALPGTLEVRATQRRIPITLEGPSMEGAGIAFQPGNEGRLARGAEVSVSFSVHGFTIDLPGRVVWFRPSVESNGRLGVALDLDSAEAPVRRSYEAWFKHSLFQERRDAFDRLRSRD